MNYLAEIRHFYDWLETESLPSNAIVLWHALMFTANRCGWREEFSVPFSVLENRTKLDKSTICRMRRILVERGVISVRGQRGRRSAIYRLNPFERHPVEHDTTVSATQIHPMTGKALQSATPTATVSIQDRIIPEKEKTSKKRKSTVPAGREKRLRRKERTQTAEPVAVPRFARRDMARTDEHLAGVQTLAPRRLPQRDGRPQVPCVAPRPLGRRSGRCRSGYRPEHCQQLGGTVPVAAGRYFRAVTYPKFRRCIASCNGRA